MDGECRVAVVGDPPTALTAALRDRAVDPIEGEAQAVLTADPDLVVACGTPAFRSVATVTPDVPVLPVASEPGVRSVPTERVGPAIEAALEGAGHVSREPVLAVERGGETVGRAVAAITLLSAEVAHISEFAVRSRAGDVAQFRADGVVVGTPAGTRGYAGRVGSPVVVPGADVCVVVPIAPFATDPDDWVVPVGPLTVSVERDETPVTVLADDQSVATVSTADPVTVSPVGHVPVLVVPDSLDRCG